MLDVSVSYNRFNFLGFEFLTWLWFLIDEKKTDLNFAKGTLSIGNKIVIENKQENRSEIISIKGDNADFEEGFLALKKGAVVTEINLVYKEEQNKWMFTIKGENINIQNIKHPEIGNIEANEDTDGYVLEKIYHYNKIIEYINNIFLKFIKLRISNKWTDSTVPQIKRWINS